MLTIARQVSICEFNVVVPISQSLGNQHTNSNQQRWWDLFGKQQPEGVVERLERNLESWGSQNKGDMSRVPDAFGPSNSTLFDSRCQRRLLASAPGGDDGKLGGVKELPVQRGVEFEGSAKVDFHQMLV